MQRLKELTGAESAVFVERTLPAESREFGSRRALPRARASRLLLTVPIKTPVTGALRVISSHSLALTRRRYAVKLCNDLRLGRRGEDDGLLILLLTDERTLEARRTLPLATAGRAPLGCAGISSTLLQPGAAPLCCNHMHWISRGKLCERRQQLWRWRR